MKRPARLFCGILCVLLFSASPVFAEFYRWIDQDGKEFFTNDRRQVPHQYQDQVSVVKPGEGRVSIAETPSVSPGKPPSAGLHKDKYGRGEEHWRKKASDLRLKLRNRQDEYSLIMKQLEGGGQKSRKTAKKKSSALETKRVRLEREISQLKRRLEVDLPEEARKADAYPGWIRE